VCTQDNSSQQPNVRTFTQEVSVVVRLPRFRLPLALPRNPWPTHTSVEEVTPSAAAALW